MDGMASAERKRVARARETLASLDDPKRDWTLPRTAPEGAAPAAMPVLGAGASGRRPARDPKPRS
jgi:hypothetical protein